jgi:hypothetical protein
MKYLFAILSRVVSIFILSLIPLFTPAQDSSASLEDGFRNPPESAKPRTWWHWTNGNITKEGIRKY